MSLVRLLSGESSQISVFILALVTYCVPQATSLNTKVCKYLPVISNSKDPFLSNGYVLFLKTSVYLHSKHQILGK